MYGVSLKMSAGIALVTSLLGLGLSTVLVNQTFDRDVSAGLSFAVAVLLGACIAMWCRIDDDPLDRMGHMFCILLVGGAVIALFVDWSWMINPPHNLEWATWAIGLGAYLINCLAQLLCGRNVQAVAD